MNFSNENRIETLWETIARENEWPDVILLKNADRDRLPSFPYSRGHIRNKVTGCNPDPYLKDKIFHVGKFPAARRKHLVTWLDMKTTGSKAA